MPNRHWNTGPPTPLGRKPAPGVRPSAQRTPPHCSAETLQNGGGTADPRPLAVPLATPDRDGKCRAHNRADLRHRPGPSPSTISPGDGGLRIRRCVVPSQLDQARRQYAVNTHRVADDQRGRQPVFPPPPSEPRWRRCRRYVPPTVHRCAGRVLDRRGSRSRRRPSRRRESTPFPAAPVDARVPPAPG